jgi:hypothetical protein
VFAATNGQPFLTQAVAFELVQFLNERHLRQATSADIEIAITRALDSAGEFFANLWDEVGTEGRAARLVLARGAEMPKRSHQDVLA